MFAALLIGIALTTQAPKEAAATPAAQSVGVVRLEAVVPEPETPRISSGFVRPDGRIVTTCGAVRGATSVTIRTSAGAEGVCSGVCAYNVEDNLLLLEVDWKSAPPAPLEVRAKTIFAPGEGRALLGEGRTVVARPLETSPENSAHTGSTLLLREKGTGAPQGRQWGGAPVLDADGKVCAAITGMKSDEGAQRRGEFRPPVLEGAGPELIRALKPGKAIPLADWGEAEARAKRAITKAFDAFSLARKDPEAALAMAKEAVELEPRSWTAWQAMGCAQRLLDDYEGAAASLEKELELAPTEVWALGTLVALRAKLGDTDQGVTMAKRHLELRPGSAEAHALMGWAYQYDGQNDEAIAAYEETLKLDPHHANAKRELARLKGASKGEDPDRTPF